MITIKDVAQRAGVSIAAVSYALNGKEGISKLKADRIIKIAEEIGYVPNVLARNLINNKTSILGIVVPDISNIYISNFIGHIEHFARENGYYLMLGSTQNIFENEKQVIKSLIAQKVDGLIITPANYYDEDMYVEIVEYINKCKVPFCLANLSFPNIKCNYVVPDLEKGSYEITKFILEKSKSGGKSNGLENEIIASKSAIIALKDIYFAGGSFEHYYTNIRFKGFCKALKEAGISSGDNRYIECQGDYDFNQGLEIAKIILKYKKLPQAVVAVNDMVAYGIIEGLKEEQISVPNDIKITGFDNIELPVRMGYDLTTVNIPLAHMAKLCVEIIQNNGDKNESRQHSIALDIIKGDTA